MEELGTGGPTGTTRTSGFVLTLFTPSRSSACDPGLTPGGSGVLVDLVKIDEQIRKAWLPFFCRGTRGNADLDAFRRVAEDLTPMLDEVELPPLIGPMLFEGVLRKKAHSW